MKRTLITLATIVILGAAYWFFLHERLFSNPGPDNLPTEAEWERIRSVEESSSQIAPNAIPGAGVVPKGSKPTPPPTPNVSTSTAGTSAIAATSTQTIE